MIAGGRLRNSPCDAGFVSVQNIRVVVSGKFPPKFQSKTWKPGSVPLRGGCMKPKGAMET